MMKEFGVGYLSDIPLSQFTATARQAEELGIDSFWMGESHYHRGVFAVAAHIASVTSKIKLGIGVVSPFTRHPVTTAMEAAAIDEASDCRLTLGLGVSRRMMLGLGIAASPLVKDEIPRINPLKAMEECIDIIRRLFSGETVDYRGEVFRLRSPGAESPGVRLGIELRRRKMPLYVGATGPKMLSLAGSIADGVLLTLLTSPSFVKFAISQIKNGLELAARPPSDVKVASYLLFSVSEDRRMAFQSLRNILALYVTRVEPIVLEKGGLDAEKVLRIEAKLREEGLVAAAKLVDDNMVRQFAVAGTPDDCLERLSEYIDAGLQMPIAMQVIGPDVKRAITLIGSKIIPELRLNKV